MADQPMSQDDIDALLAGLGGDSAAAGASDGPTQTGPAKPVDQAELDAILANLDQESATPAPAKPAAAPPASTQSGSAIHPIDQGGIDALVQNLQGQPAAAAPPPLPPIDGPLGQGELDRLMDALETPAPAAPAAPAPPPLASGAGPMGQDDIDALLAGLGAEPPPRPAPVPPKDLLDASGHLGQDDIDALLSGLAGSATPTSGPVSAPVPAAPASSAKPPASAASGLSGSLGQDDIDALISGLAGGAPPAPAPAPTQAPAPAQASASAKAATGGAAGSGGGMALGQDDIDALISGLAGGSTPATAPVAPATAAPPSPVGQLGQDDIDQLINSLGAAPPPAPPPAPPGPMLPGASKPGGMPKSRPIPAAPAPVTPGAPSVSGSLDQDGIDALLNQMGAKDVSIGAERRGMSVGGMPAVGGSSKTGNRPATAATLALSAEDLDALVNKHQGKGEDDGDAMIAQSDIDALVQQLAKATGEIVNPDRGGAPSPQDLARHDADIDKILAAAQPPTQAGTMDAVDVKAVLGRGPTGTQPIATGPTVWTTAGPPVATVAPGELRATRWLLAAAVLLLAMCSGTLVFLTGAVHALAGELSRERTAQLAPGDSYSDDFKAAAARLAAPDDEEVAKGVLFLQRLKTRYPSNEAEIALVLARHFRGHGAAKESAREYLYLVAEAPVPPEDPRVWLEYADALRQLHDRSGAVRQIYALLAREAAFTAPADPRGVARNETELAANRRALAEAHLLLGTMLAEPVGIVVADQGHGAPAAGHAAPAAASTGGHSSPAGH